MRSECDEGMRCSIRSALRDANVALLGFKLYLNIARSYVRVVRFCTWHRYWYGYVSVCMYVSLTFSLSLLSIFPVDGHLSAHHFPQIDKTNISNEHGY